MVIPPSVLGHLRTRGTRWLKRTKHPFMTQRGLSTLRSPAPSSAYIHIPFCRKKCLYCDFPVHAIGTKDIEMSQQTLKSWSNTYIQALVTEIQRTREQQSDRSIESLKTIFFGGGTPSLLSSSQLEAILNALRSCWTIHTGAEISMELDPGTFDASKLAAYRSIGVNRFSVGVQSFEDPLLSRCGRAHSVKEVLEGIAAIKEAGIPNSQWSMDLMFGLPTQTMEQWRDSLNRAVELGPGHISSYQLTLEPFTPFDKQNRKGQLRLPTDGVIADMFKECHHILTSNGYEHYEVSSYAKTGARCAHNQVYWTGLNPFYAFGTGAASFVDGVRFSRPRTVSSYLEYVQRLPQGNMSGEKETELDALKHLVMCQLRTAEGIDTTLLPSRVLSALLHHMQNSSLQKFIQIDSVCSELTLQSARIKLSQPEGYLFSNEVLVEMFVAIEKGLQQQQHKGCRAV